jgi:ABC-type dipeptide/oligopeptide/nickel transport system permease component
MIKYFFIRIIWFFIILLIVASLIYLLTSYAMWNQYPSQLTQAQYLKILFEKYSDYIFGVILRWDWGNSIHGVPIWGNFLYHVPHTMRIILTSFSLSLILGLLLGILSAVFKNSLVDKIISFFTLIFASIPNFIWVFAFMFIFGYTLKWFPPIPPSSQADVSIRLKALIIPIAALLLAPTAKFISLVRNEIVDAFYSDYILLLKTKGLTKNQILFRHLIKDSLAAIMPEIAPTFTFVISGSFLLEYINNVPGTSLLLYQALFSPMMGGHYFNVNIPVAVLVCCFYTSMGLAVVLLVDMIYPLVDPRIRIGSKKTN